MQDPGVETSKTKLYDYLAYLMWLLLAVFVLSLALFIYTSWQSSNEQSQEFEQVLIDYGWEVVELNGNEAKVKFSDDCTNWVRLDVLDGEDTTLTSGFFTTKGRSLRYTEAILTLKCLTP